MRMILDVAIHAITLDQHTFGAFGAYVAIGLAGVDAIINLLDYYVHQNWDSEVSSTSQEHQRRRFKYDIRTARRVRGEQRSLNFTLTNNSSSGSSVEYFVQGRFLLKAS